MADTLGILSTYNREKSIGGIKIDAFNAENYQFSSRGTKYPVEEGADITDHIIIDPDIINIEGVVEENSTTTGEETGTVNRVIDVFNAIREFRDNRELVTVIAGLRIYENMYIQNFNIPRTSENSRSLQFNITFETIRKVQTQVTTIPSSQLGGDPDTDNLQAQSEADVGKTVDGQTQQKTNFYDQGVQWVDENLPFLSD